jgi:hypothetical protein
MAVLILVCMLPRLAFATPAGTVLCIAIDHLSSDCHEVENVCASEDGTTHVDAPKDLADDGCLDVIGISPGKTDRHAVSAVLPHLFHAIVRSICLSPPLTEAIANRPAETRTPSFCARTFSSSIAIRS